MEILNRSMEWLRTALQSHPLIWLAGTYLTGIVGGIVIMKRKKKKD